MVERFFHLALWFNAAMLGAAFLIGRLLGVDVVATLGFTAEAVLLGVAATVPAAALLWLLDRCPFAAFDDLRRLARDKLAPLVAPLTMPQLVLLVISVGFAEEILFRGLVQGGLEQYFEPRLSADGATWLSLLLAGIVFGLCHAITPAYALFAMVMGLYLGALWVFVPPRNLLVPIVTHALYDFVAILYLVRSRERSP